MAQDEDITTDCRPWLRTACWLPWLALRIGNFDGASKLSSHEHVLLGSVRCDEAFGGFEEVETR